MLLVSRILENAADVAPDAIAATLDDDALTFGDDRARRQPDRARAARERDRAGRPACSGGATRRSRRSPCSRRAAKIGAVFAPLNARVVARRGHPRRRVRPAEARARRGRPRRARRAARPPPRRSVRSSTRSRPGDSADTAPDVELDERDPHVIFFTSGSTGRPKGVVLSHRTNWLRTFVGATTSPGRRRAPSACSRCSTWPAGRSRWARGRRGAPCTSCAFPTRRRCSRPPPAIARRGCIASPRCGAGSSSTASAATTSRRWSKPTPEPRPRRPSCSPRSRTRCRTP